MIEPIPDFVYDDCLGTVYPAPAWRCDCVQEAEYKVAMIGNHPLWEFRIQKDSLGAVVYGVRRRN